MRLLLTLAIAAAVLWTAYWALAARGLERGLAGWIETRRAEGWAADYATIEVTGYPLRFDTALSGLMLADPDTGLAWTAPTFRIEAESHRPQRVTAIWPASQQIATPDQKIALGAGRMEGRLGFRPGVALELAEGAFTLERVSLASTADWNAALARADLAVQAVEGRPATYAVDFNAEEMRPPAPLVALLDRAGLLPEVFQHMRVDAVLAFDAPWDRTAIEDRRPQITAVDIGKLDARWGDLALEAAGELDVNADGRPAGTLTVRATNWREMVEIARASGRLPEGLADRVEQGLGLLAGLSGRPETLDVALRFAAGQTWLGPVPLGPAPDFTIR
ncbi:hypothetical protein SAMN05444722_2278 [Rhodovulum sp. ES.010]|uniref:DUF2125 domain-containing protein n=1 Tax=Rhodovulum sp. ES.010 TaxID=1882821 RepID=UPI00092B0143|nr:DUF2125 domain-containing protein [Rhodovulum sp. ES.010]SIO45714.1 hypothetical protein SAMN05444722_2278 [Rhodovulum sp. ES.010]